jgi:ketosteroid isomerase-like protein
MAVKRFLPSIEASMSSCTPFLLLSLVLIPAPVSAQGPTAQAPTQRQQVQDFVRAYADAANRSDVTAYMEMYAQRTDLIAVNDGAMTLVLEKSPKGWKIIHDHTSTVAAQE